MAKFRIFKSDYLREVKSNNAKATFATYQSMLNRYERHLAAEGQDDPDLEFALAVLTLNRYKYALTTKGIKKDGPLLGQSVHGALGPIKGLCVYLIRMRIMPPDGNPFDQMELPPKVDAVRLRVCDDEVMALLAATERQSSPRRIALSMLVVFTLVHTGVRADEFQNIEAGHLNFQQETLEVRCGKGGKSRLMHPTREFWVAARGWMPFRDAMNCSRPYLFANGQRTGMRDESLRRHLEEIKAIAGLKDRINIHPHRLRGWFATHLHKQGVTVPQPPGHLNSLISTRVNGASAPEGNDYIGNTDYTSKLDIWGQPEAVDALRKALNSQPLLWCSLDYDGVETDHDPAGTASYLAEWRDVVPEPGDLLLHLCYTGSSSDEDILARSADHPEVTICLDWSAWRMDMDDEDDLIDDGRLCAKAGVNLA